MRVKYIIPLIFVLIIQNGFSQSLKPYFDKAEYKELIYISVITNANEKFQSKIPKPRNYKMIYQSQVIGIENRWDLWLNSELTNAVISIRGTAPKPESWLANFYAAMVPAKGNLLLSEKDTFKYELAPSPKAAVHIGWLISMAYLSKDILPRIDSLYNIGIKDFLIVGHSQGGAINFLLTAYLYNLQQVGTIPSDIRFKTYCSAAPKPGNLYFAYHYEMLTQNGWGYNVINSADWVPETPISIQTLNDFNTTNPFVNAKEQIKNLKFPKNIVIKSLYKKLDKPTKKAQRNYEKYLGEKASKIIMKNLNGFIPPSEYFESNNYVRTGTTIVLYADDDYFRIFPDSKEKIFIHHGFEPYLYLLKKFND